MGGFAGGAKKRVARMNAKDRKATAPSGRRNSNAAASLQVKGDDGKTSRLRTQSRAADQPKCSEHIAGQGLQNRNEMESAANGHARAVAKASSGPPAVGPVCLIPPSEECRGGRLRGPPQSRPFVRESSLRADAASAFGRGARANSFLNGEERKEAPPRSEWSQAAIALLRERWTEGHSASQIAQAIEREIGQRCSRNAVIGKLHRLGLSGRATPVRSARLIRNRLANAFVRLAPPPLRTGPRERAKLHAIPRAARLRPQANAQGEFVTVLNARDGECRFIAGDPRDDARYCARPTQARGRLHAPFCPAHERVCYLPTSGE